MVSRLHFGLLFSSVRIYEDDDGKVRGGVLFPTVTSDPFATAICCMSGPLIEELVTGVRFDEQTGSR